MKRKRTDRHDAVNQLEARGTDSSLAERLDDIDPRLVPSPSPVTFQGMWNLLLELKGEVQQIKEILLSQNESSTGTNFGILTEKK